MIDGMFQAGTDAALNDQVQRPAAPKPVEPPVFGTDLFTAPFRGIGGGVAKSMAFGAETTGAFGQVLGAAGTDSAGGMFSTQSEAERKQSEKARSVVLKSGPEMSNAVGDVLRQRAKDILPDPQTASTSAQVVSGLADFATRAVGYSVGLGPLGPLAMTGDAALEESDRLKQLGVDIGTRTKAGAVAGTLAGASIAIPMHGPTALSRFAIGTTVGEATIIGQSVAEKQILKAAGYDKISESFDPLDPVALALGLVPGALGAKFGGKPRPIKTEADMRVAAALTPAEQAHSDAYERSPANIASLEAAIKAEKVPATKAILQGELEKLRSDHGEHAVARAVEAEPDLVPAARVGQVVDAVDAARLTPDADLVGRDAHVSAVEMAADQMGRGEDVQVSHLLSESLEQERLLAEFERLTKQQENDHGQPSARGTEPAADAKAGREVVFTTLDGRARAAGEFAGATRIRGADAQPLEVFRGSGRSLSREDFHPDALGFATKNPSSGLGVFFTPDAAEAARYGKVESAHLDIRNPKVIRADEMPGFDSLQHATAFREKLRAQGYDGIIMSAEHLGGGRNIIAFDAHQVARRSERPTAAARTTQLVDALDQLRTAHERVESPAKVEPVAQVTASKASAAAPEGPKAAPAGEGEGKAPSSVARAADDVHAFDPDMLVQLEGMDAPMKVGDLLARVREEAANDVRDGKLLEVAAACDLRA